MGDVQRTYPGQPILYAVDLHERHPTGPFDALSARLADARVIIGGIAGPTGRHGLLLGTRNWSDAA